MRYFVTIMGEKGGRETILEVNVRPTGELVVSREGVPLDCDLVPLDDGSLSVRVGGRVFDLTVEGDPTTGEIGVVASGHRAYVRVESERVRAAQAARRDAAGTPEKTIVAPMPGRVAKILVKVGDAVQAGQGVVVVEAMKMENELRAKGAAVVAEIHASAGDTIEAGSRLVTFA